MSWHVSPWIYPVWDSLRFLDLIISFPILEKFFNITSNIFSVPFFFSSSSGTPYNSNVGAFNVPEVSETVLNSFHSFSLFCSAVVISTILSNRSLIRSSASVILLLIPSREFFISYFVVHHCLFAL